MRILAILPLVPWPLDRGDRMRAWELLQELSERGELTIVMVTREPLAPEARGAVAQLAKSTHVFDIGSVFWNIVVGLSRGRPPALGAYWTRRVIHAMAALQTIGWDLVVAFQLRAAPYALAVGAPLHAIDFTDSLAMFRRRLPWFGRSGLQRLLLTGVDRVEAKVAGEFEIAWVSAPDDRQVIGHLSGRYPRLVPNGCVPVELPAPYDATGPLLFMGDMRYPANEDGIVHFLRTIWPSIHVGCPDCRLRIAGRMTRRVAHAARRAGVDVLGPLQDVTAELARAAAVVNPVRFGSGSSRKILTGWAAARPVISTSTGLRGLRHADREDILVADRPKEWFSTVAWMRANPRAAAELGRAGWMRAQAEHNARIAWASALTDLSAQSVSAGAGAGAESLLAPGMAGPS